MAGSLREAWRKKTTRKGYQKKKEGLKEERCRTRDDEIHEHTKEMIFILFFGFGHFFIFFFLLYLTGAKSMFLNICYSVFENLGVCLLVKGSPYTCGTKFCFQHLDLLG